MRQHIRKLGEYLKRYANIFWMVVSELGSKEIKQKKKEEKNYVDPQIRPSNQDIIFYGP